MSDSPAFIVTIDNTKNIYNLVLNNISSQYGSFTPGLATGTGATAIEAGQTLQFSIDSDFWDNSGATLAWLTGPGNDQATIQMSFKNYAGILEDDNAAQLLVNGSPGAMMAYGGVSYLSASAGSGAPYMRDYIPSTLDAPVYITFKIVRNSFVDNPQTNFLPGIKNVVMLMLENRSLDHLLGQLYTESNPPAVVFPRGSSADYNGLGDVPVFSNSDSNGNAIVAYPIVLDNSDVPNIPDVDPGETWENVNQQIFNSPGSTSGTATMGGFLQNYEQQASWINPIQNTNDIMGFYTSGANADLPVLSGLAAAYGISDAWFCSVPSQTYTNRAFSIAGASEGCVDNWDFTPFQIRTIFNVLSDSGDNDWAIYYQDGWMGSDTKPFTKYQFSAIANDPQIDILNSIQPYSDFLTAAQNGTLPAFSYLEPAWYGFDTHGLPSSGTNGNDYHPPGNIAPGEIMLNDIYAALTSNAKAWESTLFIITFDEHGGTFDHVPPLSTIAPDQQVSSEGFDFTRLGVRVSTLLISPLIQSGMVFRSPSYNSPGPLYIPFDHTSFLKTILGWRGIDISGGVAGARAVQAPDFSGVLSATPVNPVVRTFTPRPMTDEIKESCHDQPLNDLQKAMTAALAHNITGGKPGNDEHRRVWSEMQAMKTLRELKNYVEKAKSERVKK